MDTMLRIPMDGGQVLPIPTAMTEDDFQLVMATLVLWKAKLIEKDVASRAEVRQPMAAPVFAPEPDLAPAPASAPKTQGGHNIRPLRQQVLEWARSRGTEFTFADMPVAFREDYNLSSTLQNMKTAGLLVRPRRGVYMIASGSSANGASLPKAERETEVAVQQHRPALKIEREPEATESDKDNRGVSALSAEGVRIGRTLIDPWSATDLQARLDGVKGRAFEWISLWKRKGWIDTVGFGQYRKTASFGE